MGLTIVGILPLLGKYGTLSSGSVLATGFMDNPGEPSTGHDVLEGKCMELVGVSRVVALSRRLEVEAWESSATHETLCRIRTKRT